MPLPLETFGLSNGCSEARQTSSPESPYEPCVLLSILTMSTFNEAPVSRLPRSQSEVCSLHHTRPHFIDWVTDVREVDRDVLEPILFLLQNPDIEVQRAASAALGNLAVNSMLQYRLAWLSTTDKL